MYEWARFEVCAIRVFLVITVCVGLNDMFRRRIIFVPQLENLLKITWNYTICHILSLVTLHSNIITCLTKWTALKLRCWAFIANATCHAKLHGNLWITFTVIVKKQLAYFLSDTSIQLQTGYRRPVPLYRPHSVNVEGQYSHYSDATRRDTLQSATTQTYRRLPRRPRDKLETSSRAHVTSFSRGSRRNVNWPFFYQLSS